MKKVHSQKVKPRKLSDTASLYRNPPIIQHRQMDPTVVETVTIGPNHTCDASILKIEHRGGIFARVGTGFVDRVRLRVRGVHAGCVNERINVSLEIVRCLIGIGQIFAQVRRKLNPRLLANRGAPRAPGGEIDINRPAAALHHTLWWQPVWQW
jgi:hypothetical protein